MSEGGLVLLGLPSHLAPQSSGRAIARACHGIATVLLVAATVVVVSAQISDRSLVLWPALIALVPMLALLVLIERVRSTLSTVAYLAVGAVAVYVFAFTILSQFSWATSSDAFTLSLPKLALVMVGGSGLYARRGPLWATFGLVAGEIATQIATWQAGAVPRVDVTTLLGYVLIVATMGGSLVARDRARRVQPNLHRAARDQQLSVVRHEIEQQASALVHDTVLSHLAALSVAPAGRLDPALVADIERDLESIVGQEWLHEATADASAVQGTWEASDLARSVAQAIRQGLDVVVTGDVAAVGRLDPAVARALALAVTQCFANVLKHAGTREAELVLLSSDADVTVMVIDSGVGFDETKTPDDRLGLRNSIRARVERVGGSVQVWSSPGSGTSVMFGLPTRAGSGASESDSESESDSDSDSDEDAA